MANKVQQDYIDPEAIASVYFESKNLIINVQTNTTCDADAYRLSLLNSSFISAYINNLNTTFDITTDLMAGTSEKNSHWYQLWIDSSGTRLMVPDLTGTADGTAANKLDLSTATFVTDKVSIGDIVYNMTDITQTTVTAIDSEDILSLADDIFVSGEDFKIRMLSPTGLSTAFKARIGATFNNSSGHLDDSTYTQVQEEKYYNGDGTDFTLTSSPAVTAIRKASLSIRQINDWTGLGIWKVNFNLNYVVASGTRTQATATISDITFKNVASFTQPVSAFPDSATSVHLSYAITNTSNIQVNHANVTSAAYSIFGEAELERKAAFHN